MSFQVTARRGGASGSTCVTEFVDHVVHHEFAAIAGVSNANGACLAMHVGVRKDSVQEVVVGVGFCAF